MILKLTILQVVACEDDYFMLLCLRNPQRLMSMLFIKIQLGEYIESTYKVQTLYLGNDKICIRNRGNHAKNKRLKISIKRINMP